MVGTSDERVVEFEDDDGAADAFVDIAFRARAQDARWIPSPRASQRKALHKDQPLYRHVGRRFFLVDGERAYGRCAAFVNPRLKDDAGKPYGQIGMYEVSDDDVGERVIERALAWLQERGCEVVLAPMNGSTWHSYRFVDDWKEMSPLLLEPNTPTSYASAFRELRFAKHRVPYYSGAHNNAAVVDALGEKFMASHKAGYRMVPVDLRDLQGVLKKMYELSLAIFCNNAFYSDITWDEFAALYEGSERLLDPSLVEWLLAPSGDVVGFAFGIPDYADAVRAMRGESGLMAKLRFAMAKKPTRTLVKTVGIMPEHRGRHLLSTLYYSQAKAALDGGYQTGVVTLMAADNLSHLGTKNLQTVMREYALYVRTVDA